MPAATDGIDHVRANRPFRVVFPRFEGLSVLIVRTDFFIDRFTGEVAEWSKALPC
jgi:hypothetical protein